MNPSCQKWVSLVCLHNTLADGERKTILGRNDAVDREHGIEIGFQEETGEILMLDKRERKLVTLLLDKLLKSKSGRLYIGEKLGMEFLEIGEKLFRELSGNG